MFKNALFLDLYELTMAESYFRYKRNSRATFDLCIRQLPAHRSYLVACGLEDVLEYIQNLRFDPSDLQYLKKQNIFSDGFLSYLSDFKFTGDIWAMPEGTIFFAQEPLIRVTAPLIEGQMIESYLLNTINLQTMLASKASRVVSAARGRGVYDFSLRRTHGFDAALKAARSSYIAGCEGTSNVLAGKKYNIPVVGTMAHAYVMAFGHELDSFIAYASSFPGRTILLVDTYDTIKGIDNAITIGRQLAKKRFRLQGIRLDSGDIGVVSKYARSRLDKAGLEYVQIIASGNLDEFRISELLKTGAAVDSFGVGTNMGASVDAPSLDIIYKISEISDARGKYLPTMKLSKDKVTFPGRKQVVRIMDKNGRAKEDVICIENEKTAHGVPLLRKVVEAGSVTCKGSSLEQIRKRVQRNLASFDPAMLDVSRRYSYLVRISKGLSALKDDLYSQLSQRQ